jgi:hypothetical protein
VVMLFRRKMLGFGWGRRCENASENKRVG